MAKPKTGITKTVETERFFLVNCNSLEAFRITDNWRRSPEIMQNMMMGKKKYTHVEWMRRSKVNWKNKFLHAIVAKDNRKTVGAHSIAINKAGTASLGIVIHAERWHGEGAFEEVRAAMLDHFCSNPEIVRFFGHVRSRNFASIYNYQKLGFRLIGYEKKRIKNVFTDEHEDTMRFEMLADDWRAKRGLNVDI